MRKVKYPEDFELAKEVCKQLKAGNGKAFTAVFQKYHRRLLKFAMGKLSGWTSRTPEDVLNDFWLEQIEKRPICDFDGRSSLKSFLFGSFRFRIIDEYRRTGRERDRMAPNDMGDKGGRSKEEVFEATAFSEGSANGQASTTYDLGSPIPNFSKRVLDLALLDFAEISIRDANLIRMYLQGMTYKEMAQEEMKYEDPNSSAIESKENAIKKQFKRPRTGSLAKFQIVLVRKMLEFGLEVDDMINR